MPPSDSRYVGTAGAEPALGPALTPLRSRRLSQVSALHFDSREELLVCGLQDGHLSTHLCPDLTQYTAFPGHKARVVQLLPLPDLSLMLSASAQGIKGHKSGGLGGLAFVAGEGDSIACIGSVPSRRPQVAVGYAEPGIGVLDVARGEMVGRHETEHGTTAISGPSKRGGMVFGSSKGEVSLRDPRTGFKQETKLEAFSGAVTSIATNGGELMAACGLSNRMGQVSVDPLIKVFDIRFGARMVAHIPFSARASIVRFHPRLSETVLAFSSTGTVLMADVQATGSANQSFQMPLYPGAGILSAEISSTGDLLAFGDSTGIVHLWGSHPKAAVNMYSAPTEIPQLPDFAARRPIGEGAPLSALPKYYSQGRLLSSFNDAKAIRVGRAPHRIDAAVLKSMQMSDFVGYVKNDKYVRGKPFGEATKAVAHLRTQRHKPLYASKSADGDRRQTKKVSKDGTVLPDQYHYLEIKKPKASFRRRFEQFDFAAYNMTRFAGLENNIANCYCNGLLQVLFFNFPLCHALLQNKPARQQEFSLTDELSFLMHMLKTAQLTGVPCQAQNLLRALRQIKEAAALGLLEVAAGTVDMEIETNKDYNLRRRCQSLSRFLLEHLHKEGLKEGNAAARKSNLSLVSAACGTTVETLAVCNACKGTMSRSNMSFQVDMQYPRQQEAGRADFCSVLRKSIMQESDLRAWCDKCKAYKNIVQKRLPRNQPQTLVINCGIQDPGHLAWWHQGPRAGGGGWAPAALTMQLDPKARDVRISEGVEEGGCTYDLTAVLTHIVDDDEALEGEGMEGHMVAFVKLYGPYAGKSDEGEWVLINDFSLEVTKEAEVHRLYGERKVPCLLYYTQRSVVKDAKSKQLASSPVLTKSGFHSICEMSPLQGPHAKLFTKKFTPLSQAETPQKGSLYAIDAEFVALSKAQTEIKPDGSETVTRQARLGLARVSVVRGDGPNMGVCCIDDYVRTVEPVHDYLTRFSGLVKGDLDSSTSKHHLTTLKNTYLKLRYMVDMGCRFIGHGLQNDLRMINIILPPEQVIDTVKIFRLKNQRLLSLRFLASYLLSKDIQGQTHDSIEDAKTALELYQVYVALEESGRLRDKIEEMYDWGAAHGWDTSHLPVLNA